MAISFRRIISAYWTTPKSSITKAPGTSRYSRAASPVVLRASVVKRPRTRWPPKRSVTVERRYYQNMKKLPLTTPFIFALD